MKCEVMILAFSDLKIANDILFPRSIIWCTRTKIQERIESCIAESSTALRNISARLVQQTLRTVSIVFLTLLDFVRTFVLFTLIVLTVLT